MPRASLISRYTIQSSAKGFVYEFIHLVTSGGMLKVISNVVESSSCFGSAGDNNSVLLSESGNK